MLAAGQAEPSLGGIAEGSATSMTVTLTSTASTPTRAVRSRPTRRRTAATTRGITIPSVTALSTPTTTAAPDTNPEASDSLPAWRGRAVQPDTAATPGTPAA